MTPMLRQYLEIKEKHPDEILFYRMGDFYEMFFEDAEDASQILNITLTARNNKSDGPKIPMCGVPYHAAQTYISKLVGSGRRVAICEQTEDPAQAKGIVRREVIRIISPGVVTDDQLLDEKENRYVCAICRSGSGSAVTWGISFLDLSTGEFLTGEFEDESDRPDQVLELLSRMSPAEILLNEDEATNLAPLLKAAELIVEDLCITERPTEQYHIEPSLVMLTEHFNVINMDGFGCATLIQGVIAAAILLEYVQETQKTDVSHIEKLVTIEFDNVLLIDDASRRNLELTRTIIGNKREGSLLAVLDKSCTPMGARLLKRYLLQPLQDIKQINDRLDAVGFLHEHSNTRQHLRDGLRSIYDLERLNSRMVLGQGNGRDAIALKQSFARLPEFLEILQSCGSPKLEHIFDEFDILSDLHDLLEAAVADDPPVTLRDGNLIRKGYNEELDELLLLLRDGKKLILGLEKQERETTGIAKLKVGYNKVFGYYIEISNVNLDKVPDHYIRKQTLVNAERFITPELKEFESRVLTAQERRLEIEYQLFLEVRTELARNSSRIIKTAHLLAQVDVLCCLAEVARQYNYRKPQVTNEQAIVIVEGRHPVIERALPSGKFVPNDIVLDHVDNQMLIITGPNMAGKSTILRQTALIVLMAQMGSFVPADKASLAIVDRIFTRVGAMDDLRRGQSTFMVEMSETANILNNATPRSLVILDEIGRGTSTYDGLSIAWSVAEALIGREQTGVKTLFATHYHELTELARSQPRTRNLSVAVKEWNNTIIFLHKLVKGGTSRSYGIQVAALAGVPLDVVTRAEEILKKIDRSEFDYQRLTEPAPGKRGRKTNKPEMPNQLSLFKQPSHPILDEIRNARVDDMTPREAIEMLYRLNELL